MAITRAIEDPGASNRRSQSKAGTVSRIRLENFMCHSNLEIELGDYVNFITGQNGSGKSAILTALCVAFGCRARSTQRASTLKDFIKTGCHYAVVVAELKNRGEDAFSHETYGDTIIIERRISQSSSVITMKDNIGRKVATGRDKLHELVEHFSIDVDNPCVIMTQDKSREFLHSGNSKDKFQFFYKATLLQVVDELLKRIRTHVESTNGLVAELERSNEPAIKELKELERKIESLEQVERILEQVKQLRQKLAWALVYDDDKKLQEQGAKLEKAKKNKPQCEARINKCAKILEDLRECSLKKEADLQHLLERSSEVTKMKGELSDQLRKVTIEKRQMEDERRSRNAKVEELKDKLKKLETLMLDTQEQHIRDTQAEENAMQEKLKALEDELNEVTSLQMRCVPVMDHKDKCSESDGFYLRLSDEEISLLEAVQNKENEIREITAEIEGKVRKLQEISFKISELEKSQINKVNAFGGAQVYKLLHVLERHHHKFRQPPIGPIGAHLNLINNDWAGAVENAVGGLFNAFIVTDHKDSLLLRSCAQEARYHNLTILIYDFSRPRINVPPNMLPQTSHPTVLSALHSDSPTVMNVLVDMGSAERQVLVQDYDVGKSVAFVKRVPNLKEVYTKDGYKMFYRGSVQTTLPPTKWARSSRLCSSYADQIEELKREKATMNEHIQHDKQRKRSADCDIIDLRGKKETVKRRRLNLEKDLSRKKLDYQGLKDAYANTVVPDPASSVDEANEEISIVRSDIQRQETTLEKLTDQIEEVGTKIGNLKESFEMLRESAQVEIDAMIPVEQELEKIQDQLKEAAQRKRHYERLLVEKVQTSIEADEEEYQKLQKKREEDFEKATQICPESVVKDLGGCEDKTPEQLANQLKRLQLRLQQESQNSLDSLDDLRSMYEDRQNKVRRKQKIYEHFRQKLNACEKALNLRQKNFERSATLLSRELTWQFNTHLRRKGISGKVEVDFKQKTLSIEVTMPQDGSVAAVRDTRGLSGGERSFSTLCFALTLHAMTEAPFRAMDEFDVFMDAVSRKISLDTLLEFALEQGSQWIFITPHDISMVKPGERVKKQQLAAPRS